MTSACRRLCSGGGFLLEVNAECNISEMFRTTNIWCMHPLRLQSCVCYSLSKVSTFSSIGFRTNLQKISPGKESMVIPRQLSKLSRSRFLDRLTVRPFLHPVFWNRVQVPTNVEEICRHHGRDVDVSHVVYASCDYPVTEQWVWVRFVKNLWPDRKEDINDLHEYDQFVKHAIRMGNESFLKSLVTEQGKYIAEVEGLLQCAIKSRNPSILEYLIQSGVNINEADTDGRTPLHIAATIGSMPCTKLLFRYKANTNVKNVWGRTPLMLAVINNHDSLTKFLVTQGADVNSPDNDGKVPIHILTSYGKIQMLEYFLALPRVNRQAKDRAGRTIISLASIARNETILQFLFDSGCSMSFGILSRFSPIHDAFSKHNIACAKILLHEGASVDFEFGYKTDRGLHNYSPLQLCLNKLHLINAMAYLSGEPYEKVKKGLVMLDLIIKVNGSNEAVDSLNKIINFSKANVFKKFTADFNSLIRKILLIGYIENNVTKKQLAGFEMDDVVTLKNISRVHIRKRLMRSRKNLLWACDRLTIPDTLKQIILLEDI